MLRRLFIGFVLLASFSLTLAQSSRQATLVIGADLGDLIGFDPAIIYEFSGSLIGQNIYETLVRFEGTDLAVVRPGLAESWEVTQSAEGNSITFHLREAKFASGNPVTAQDVVYSFDRVIALAGPASFLFSEVMGLAEGSTVAVDDSTVQVNMPANINPSLALNVLTFVTGAVVDSAVAQEHEQDGDRGQAWLAENSAGSGAYELVRWDKGAQILLQANPNASRSGPIERVVLRNMQESAAQQAALQSGEIDIAYDFTPEAFLAAEQNADLKAYRTDTFQMNYLGMNSGADAPFEDNRIRQAVRHAINQDEIIENLLSGLGRKMQTIVPAGLLGANTNELYDYNPETAKALLTDAGAEGLEVDFLVSTGACGGGIPCTDLATKIQSDLAAVGITANIRQLVQSELLTIYRAQDAEMVLVGWSPDFPDPDGNATPLGDYNASSLAWRNDWNNPVGSALAKAAATESDNARRVELYNALTEYVALHGPFAILYQPYKAIVTGGHVNGFVRNAQGDVDFSAISKE